MKTETDWKTETDMIKIIVTETDKKSVTELFMIFLIIINISQVLSRIIYI